MTPPALELRVRERVRQSPLFDAREYLAANSDLRGTDPVEHFARHGLWERRVHGVPQDRWARLGQAAAAVNAPPFPRTAQLARVLEGALDLRVRIDLPAGCGVRSRVGAEHLAAALAASGAEVTWDAAGAPSDWTVRVDPSRAPVDPAGSAELQHALARSVLLLTEAPDGDEFDREILPQALLAAGVIALSPETCGVLGHSGVPSFWLPPPLPPRACEPPPAWAAVFAEDVRACPAEASWASRPIEVAAFGEATERRIASWLGLATPLARRRNVVHAPRPRPDRSKDDDHPLRLYVHGRTRIALHLQADAPTSPDWLHVCAGALAQGAVLVSEPGLPHPLLDPERHLFEVAPRRMPSLIDWLLDTEEGRMEAEARRTAAAGALRAAGDPVEIGARAAEFLLSLRRIAP